MRPAPIRMGHAKIRQFLATAKLDKNLARGKGASVAYLSRAPTESSAPNREELASPRQLRAMAMLKKRPARGRIASVASVSRPTGSLIMKG